MKKAYRLTLKTKERLLQQGARLFAACGYESTSLRDITAAAGANLCAIKYYFGDKAAFYQACVQYIWAQQPSPIAAIRLDRVKNASEWRRAVQKVVHELAIQMLSPDPTRHQLSMIMNHEMLAPTPALHLIGDEIMRPKMKRFEQLIAMGFPPGVSALEIRLRAFLVLSQLMAFSLCTPMADLFLGSVRHQRGFIRIIAAHIAATITQAGRFQKSRSAA